MIKKLKKLIGHEKLVSDGYKLTKIFKGFFKVGNAELILPVFQYKKTRFAVG